MYSFSVDMMVVVEVVVSGLQGLFHMSIEFLPTKYVY